MDVLLLVLRLLIAALLYASLAGIAWLLWQDLRQAGAEEQSVARAAAQLVVLAVEAEKEDERALDALTRFHAGRIITGGVIAGRVYELQPVTSIGRASNNTIQ